MAAFTPDSGRPTEALPDDAGHLPSEKAVTEKRRQDTKEADVTVSLKVVFTSKDRKNTDTRIKELAGAITRQFKEYGLTNFVLLDSKELKLSPASTVPVELPGGRRLVIANSGLRDNKVVLGLEMNGLIKTTILLTQKGRFMFGGPKYKFGRGMVILVIKARRS
jgi:hypothetical protein